MVVDGAAVINSARPLARAVDLESTHESRLPYRDGRRSFDNDLGYGANDGAEARPGQDSQGVYLASREVEAAKSESAALERSAS